MYHDLFSWLTGNSVMEIMWMQASCYHPAVKEKTDFRKLDFCVSRDNKECENWIFGFHI